VRIAEVARFAHAPTLSTTAVKTSDLLSLPHCAAS
jgi:hypothetical protein